MPTDVTQHVGDSTVTERRTTIFGTNSDTATADVVVDSETPTSETATRTHQTILENITEPTETTLPTELTNANPLNSETTELPAIPTSEPSFSELETVKTKTTTVHTVPSANTTVLQWFDEDYLY